MELEAMTVLGTRLSNGDSRAVEDVYQALGPRVLSYLRRRVPYDEAEDVLQRVFFEVWRSRDRYDPDRSLEAWVFAIARKRAIDHLRRPHHVTVPIDLVRDLAGADGREDADNLVWAREVRRGLDRLAAEQREVLELAYFGGRTQVEIASELGLPLGTVKARMFRGLRRMGHTMGIRRQRASTRTTTFPGCCSGSSTAPRSQRSATTWPPATTAAASWPSSPPPQPPSAQPPATPRPSRKRVPGGPPPRVPRPSNPTGWAGARLGRAGGAGP